MRKAQRGFTLIELVIVIVILGILAATALPRFIDIQKDAHEAAVSGAGGAFTAGIALAHAKWLATGQPTGAMDLDGDGTNDVYMNSNGWPSGGASDDGTIAAGDHSECVNLWNGVFGQNPPTVSATAGAADYQAQATANTCTYTYQRGGTMSITYVVTNGAVTVDAVY